MQIDGFVFILFILVARLYQSLFSGENEETICIKCQSLFSWKNKKYIISMSSAELAHCMVKT